MSWTALVFSTVGRRMMWFPSSRPWTSQPAKLGCSKDPGLSHDFYLYSEKHCLVHTCSYESVMYCVSELWDYKHLQALRIYTEGDCILTALSCSCLYHKFWYPYAMQLRWLLDSTTTLASTPSSKLSLMRSRPTNSLCNQPQENWYQSHPITGSKAVESD